MQEQNSRGYQLLKQNQSIFSRLKQRVNDINQTDQKIRDNIKNIRTPSQMRSEETLQKQNYFYPQQYSFNVPEVNMQQNYIQHPIQEISFCNNKQNLVVVTSEHIQSIVFIPFNKLYRSPIIQLKGKDRLIFARKYKGSNLIENKGKISDGKNYKFTRIITQEDQLFETLNNPFQIVQSNIIGIVGAKSTLKKKIHMCLLIKEYQRLKKRICSVKFCKVEVHYSQISEKSLTINEQQVLDIREQTRSGQLTRLNRIFEHLIQVITNKNKYYGKKSKNRTRISRIILGSENQRYLLEIVSTNNQNLNFIKQLQVNKIVWCINPLMKNYDNTQLTLQNVCKYQKQLK